MEQSETVKQEIANLEQQLAEKRASLEQRSAETQAEVPHEKETLREMIGEKIQQYTSGNQSTSSQSASSVQQDDTQVSDDDSQSVNKVQELVNIVFSSNLDNAIKSA